LIADRLLLGVVHIKRSGSFLPSGRQGLVGLRDALEGMGSDITFPGEATFDPHRVDASSGTERRPNQ
jgi:hypothetical protein